MMAATQLVGTEHAVEVTLAAWALVHGLVLLELPGQLRHGVPMERVLLGLQAVVQG